MRLYDRATKKGRLICYQQTMSGISWGIYETAARAGAGAVRGRGGGEGSSECQINSVSCYWSC